MTYEVVELSAEDIKIEDRYREEMGDVESLAEDIKKHGLLQPVTVNSEYKLLAGGRRYAACVEAGLTAIPAIIRESQGEVEELEIELVENLHRKDLTWWEDAMLTAKIYNLTKDEDSELSKKRKKRKKGEGSARTAGEVCGKSLAQVSRDLKLASSISVMPELKKCKSKNEAINLIDRALHSHDVSTQVQAASEQYAGVEEEFGEPGQDDEQESAEERAARLFKRAESNYKVGDAINGLIGLGEHFKSQGYSPFGLIEIDPPYGVDLHAVKSGSEANKEDYMKDYNEVEKEDYPEFLRKICNAAFDCCNDSGFVVLWFGWEWYWEAYRALIEAGFYVDYTPGIWIKASDEGKGATGQTNQPKIYLARSHEPFFVARKDNSRLAKEGRANSFIFKPTPPSQKYHPTQRPLDLMEEVIKTFCWPGLGVLSPFLGSGITLLASYELGYNAMGWDLSEESKKHFLNMVLEHYKEN